MHMSLQVFSLSFSILLFTVVPSIYSFVSCICNADMHNAQVTGKWHGIFRLEILCYACSPQTVEIKMYCLIHNSLLLVHFTVPSF